MQRAGVTVSTPMLVDHPSVCVHGSVGIYVGNSNVDFPLSRPE